MISALENKEVVGNLILTPSVDPMGSLAITLVRPSVRF